MPRGKVLFVSPGGEVLGYLFADTKRYKPSLRRAWKVAYQVCNDIKFLDEKRKTTHENRLYVN